MAQSIVIPRVVAVLAGGRYTGATDARVIELAVTAAKDGADWGIIQSPFMRDKARTVSFRHQLAVEGDVLRYSETTGLEIYGRHFDHTDTNELTPDGTS